MQIKKKQTMKTLRQILLLVIIFLFVIPVISYGQQSKPWEVPAKYKTMKNPVKADEAGITAGKDLYNKNCAACHGRTGLGDGPKSKGLTIPVASFMKAEYQNQSEGDQFYKSKFGRGEMPKYEGKIDDNGIWQILIYIKTLKK
jgi:mono/diheme cytochrome c family protein